jgi:uncharacterized protein (TIGR02284 family)
MGNPNIPPTTPAGTVTTPSPAEAANQVRRFTSDEGLGRSSGATPESAEAVNRELIATLNELIETCKDGEKGFALAAKDANDPALTPLFTDGERSCRTAAAELQEQVRALGGNPDESGSVKGAVHRGWISLKTAVTSRDAKAILEECERGEDYAKAQYAAALKVQMPEGIRQLVERQYQGVMSNHDRVRDLRNQYRAQ